MGLPEVLDRHIPHHWTQRGLSWGWTAVIWLAYIVSSPPILEKDEQFPRVI
jgi:transposase